MKTKIILVLALILLLATVAYASSTSNVYLPVVIKQVPITPILGTPWTPSPTDLVGPPPIMPTVAPTMNPFPLTPTPTPVTICIPEPCDP